MKAKALSILIAILFVSSCTEKNYYSNLYGTWKPVESVENELKISIEVTFNELGEYKAISYSEDSVIYEINGAYHVDERSNLIELMFTEIKKNEEIIESKQDTIFAFPIIKLTEKELILLGNNYKILKYTKTL